KNGTVLDLIVANGTIPAGEVPAVENLLETFGIAGFPQSFVGFVGGNLADEDVPPANLAAVRLQLDRPFPQKRLFAIPEVLQAGVVDDQLVIEIYRGPFAQLDNAEVIPFAERLIGQHERIFAGRAGTVVPQAAATLVSTNVPLAAFLGVIPNLHLRRGPQVNAAITLGQHLVIDQQFDVAIVRVGGQVDPIAVVDDFPFLDFPVFFDILVPFLDLGFAVG